MKQKLILAGIGLAALFTLYWVFGHAYLEVTVPTNGEHTYTVTNLANNKKATIKSSDTSAKKLLPTGNYQVMVQGPDGSYLATAEVKRFLQKTTLASTPTPERARRFVGNSPSPCTTLSASVMFSYECSSPFNSVLQHVPATATSPTYVLPNKATTAKGNIEGIIQTSEGIVVLLKTASADQGDIAHHIHLVSPDFKTATPKNKFTVSDITRAYAIKPYQGGFVTYRADNFEDIHYFSSAAAVSQPIDLGKIDIKFKATALNTSDDTLLVNYSNDTNNTKANLDSIDVDKDVKNKLVIRQGNETKQLDFIGHITEAHPCGKQLLCLLQSKRLTVYDISGSKPKALHTLTGIHSIVVSRKTILAESDADKTIFSINPQTGAGYIAYDLGKYDPCGISATPNGMLLCTIDPKNTKRELSIDLDTADNGAIDKKLLDLQSVSQIKTLSIYGKYVYIVPELGKLEYIPAQKGYGFNPAITQAVNKIIDDKVNSLGIEQAGYTVVNTAK